MNSENRVWKSQIKRDSEDIAKKYVVKLTFSNIYKALTFLCPNNNWVYPREDCLSYDIELKWAQKLIYKS